MAAEKNLEVLLKEIKPNLNDGDFVFCTLANLAGIDINDTLMIFKEQEGITVLINRQQADHLHLPYSFVASWITLSVHSALDAVGLTAAFSKALSEKNISCNVVAAYYHDHIFVDKKDTEMAMQVLNSFSQ
jgi:uncharacterized protein